MEDEDYEFDYEDSDQVGSIAAFFASIVGNCFDLHPCSVYSSLAQDQDDGQVDMENEYYTAKGHYIEILFDLITNVNEILKEGISQGGGGRLQHELVP